MVVERGRKQQRAERALGNYEIGRENWRSENVGDKPMKRGRKPEVLESKLSESDTGEEEKKVEERKENGVSHKEENIMNEDGISEIGEHSGEKENETGVKGRINGNLKESLDFVDENAKGNGEYIAVGENAKENGEYTEQRRESEVSKGDRKVKFDENCQVMGEVINGVSENIMVPYEFISWSRKRKRKKVNYYEDEVDGDDEGIFGKKRKQRRRGRKVDQKRKILTAEKVQENDANDKEENRGVNSQKRGRKVKNSEKASETEGLKSKGGEEDDEAEVNKLRRRGPKKQGKIVREESAGGLGHVEHEKFSSQCNDERCFILRMLKNREEQKQKENMHVKWIENESMMCHQCQRNDKGRVVRCQKCKRKRFCIPCITNWYPKMSEDEIANSCPVCSGYCNCKACLRLEGVLTTALKELDLESDPDSIKPDRVQHSEHLLRKLLPCIRRLSEEQLKELAMEAKIRGLSTSEIQPQKRESLSDERAYCNNCRTSIVDFHRSCPNCNYDLCLICCWEIRDGHLQVGDEEVIMEYPNKAPYYLPGKMKHTESPKRGRLLDYNTEIDCMEQKKSVSNWKANENGSIPCPSNDLGGCGNRLLELRCMFTENWVAELVTKAEQIAKAHNLEDMPESSMQMCTCYNSVGEIDWINSQSRKAASRKNSSDNYLYSPTAKGIQHGDLKHFQWHWAKGEPVIVSNVLDNALGLSWEPMVMWRASSGYKEQAR